MRRKSSMRVLFATLAFSVLLISAVRADQVAVQVGNYRMTRSDLDAVVALYGIALDKQLSSAAAARLRELSIDDFRQNTQAFANNLPGIRQAVSQYEDGHDPFQGAWIRLQVWGGTLTHASEPTIAPIFALMKEQTPVIASGDGVVVTQLQVTNYFKLLDDIAQTAHVPPYTAAQRAAFLRTLPTRFGSMSHSDHLALGQAEARREGLIALLNSNAGEAAAPIRAEIAHCVRSTQDLTIEARSLGDAGMLYEFSVGHTGPTPGEDSTDTITRVNAQSRRTTAFSDLAGGQAFWPAQPCGHG